MRIPVQCWFSVLIGLLLGLQTLNAAAQDGGFEPPCGGGLVFIGQVDTEPGDERLGQQIAGRVADGLRFDSDERPERKSGQVASYYELKEHERTTIPSLQTLRRYKNTSVESSFRSLLGKNQNLAGYAQVALARHGDQKSVSIALYCFPQGEQARTPEAVAKLTARKLVRGFGDDDVLLSRVFSASRKLSSTNANRGARNPIPLVSGGTTQTVVNNSLVTLDASGSADPEFDEIVVIWTCHDKTLGCEQRGSKLVFLPTRIGDFDISLSVSKLIDPQFNDSSTIHLKVVAPPHVTASESRMLLLSQKTKIDIVGTCESCSEWTWEEIAGPEATVPSTCHGVGQSASCSVEADTPGEYTFALTGRNVLGTDRKEVTVGAAPRAIAIAAVPAQQVIGHTSTFDASSSYDMFGGKLRYHWQVTETAIDDGYCGPVDQALPAGMKLSSPLAATTEFESDRRGTYFVRLTVLADRKFNGHSTTNQACSKYTVTVVEPTWLPFLIGGSDWVIKPLSNEPTDPASEGFRLKLGTTIRPVPAVSWFGIRIAQTVLRTNADRKHFTGLGGTTVGVAWLPTREIQAYFAGSARGWDGFAVGPEFGGELRLRRYLVLSGLARYEHGPYGWQLVGGVYFGGGLDL